MATNNTTNTTVRTAQKDDFIRLQDLFYLCLAKWYWIVISLVITIGIALVYLLTTPQSYTRSASILIKEDAKGNAISGDISSTFADMGLFQSSTNVNNELISLRSPAVMLDVVKRLHLDINYRTDGTFYKRTLYGSELPYTVSFPKITDSEAVSLTMNVKDDGVVTLQDFIYYRNGEEQEDNATVVSGMPGDTLRTPAGLVIVTPTPYRDTAEKATLYITRTPLHSAVENCSQNLTVSLSDEKATVINLSYVDVCIQRAEDLLNTLISVYNENWVKDKNQIAVSTSMFINDRLGVIEGELGNVDENISSFKSEHLLPDVQAASNLYMTQSSETSSKILALNTQLSMARYIRGYLTSSNGQNQLLPANSGLESANIEKQISDYNAMQLQRNSLVANSSEQNPLVQDLDQSLKALRGAVVISIDNLITSLNTQIRSLQQNEKETTGKIAASPDQAKYLLSVERQQKVKEALYLFLLQKREENELSQAFTAYNTRIITPPTGKLEPTAPIKRNILLVAFALGLLIPVVIIFLKENMDTAIRGRKDIEGLTLPFIGEIPQSNGKKRRFFASKRKEDGHLIAVKEKNRNVINEAFRVVRTNLEFMAGKEGSRVIMLTSCNPGSGKTFISANLALSLAIKGKKVLAIDLDLRKASLSGYVDSPKKGIADYLSGHADSLESIVVKGSLHEHLDVIPVGTIPPNPTELLFEAGLEKALEELKKKYDYIFIDCPPVEIVADASIIGKMADYTLFIVRAGLLDKSMLPVIEKYYTDKKYNGLSLLLNGTENYAGKYGYHRHGYGYGYGNYGGGIWIDYQ